MLRNNQAWIQRGHLILYSNVHLTLVPQNFLKPVLETKIIFFYFRSFPDRALLRRHPPPKMENFAELKTCAASRNWRIETWSNKVLSESLDSCVDKNDPNVNFVLRGLATHAMVQAVYFSTGYADPYRALTLST